jgi:hypothetical protein
VVDLGKVTPDFGPFEGERVKIYFKNGLVEEGIVEFWSQHKSVLRAISGNNLFIIQNTLQDVLGLKIFRDQPSISDVHVDTPTLKERIPDENLRAMKLADLHKLRAQEERKRAREKLTTFSIETSASGQVNYGTPNFGKPVSNGPPEKIR